MKIMPIDRIILDIVWDETELKRPVLLSLEITILPCESAGRRQWVAANNQMNQMSTNTHKSNNVMLYS